MTIKTILDVIEPGDIVYDIGAHQGNKAATYLARGARVVCFEPQPQLSEHLRQRFAAEITTDPPRVLIEPYALGAKPGRLDLALCDTETTLATFSSKWRTEGRFSDLTWSRNIRVGVHPLAHVIERLGRPKYCKIDVEGFEASVLDGLPAATNQLPKYLSFEFHREMLSEARTCIVKLSQLGYSGFNVCLGEDPVFQFVGSPIWATTATALTDWCDGDFANVTRDPKYWGDIYARL